MTLVLWCRDDLFRFVDRRFATFHGQGVEFDRWGDVPNVGLPTRLGPIGFGRWMFVFGRSDGLMGGTVLGLLDAWAFGRVFFVAQFERDGETFLVGRARFAGQSVLVLDLVVPCQLIN